MTTLLLLGATGLVGREVLRQATADPRVSRIIAPTRRPLPHAIRVQNPVIPDFEELPTEADWWAVDAVICALGTTLRDAGSRRAFRTVDHDYPLTAARIARAHGARTYVLNSSLGADPDSRNFYLRTKGQIERAIATCGYTSMTAVRPSLIGGERDQRRPMEQFGIRVLGLLGPLVPRRYRVTPATAVARALLEAAVAPVPGQHIVDSAQI